MKYPRLRWRLWVASFGVVALSGAAMWAGCGGDEVPPLTEAKTYALQLDLSNFAPHASQKVEGRAVDVMTGEEVARASATGDVAFTLFFDKALKEGHSYRVDFYADLNKNGEYTPPVGDPATAWPDHQWRILSTTDTVEGAAGLENVSGDVRLKMSHNAKWTDIDWPGSEANSGVMYYDAMLRLTNFKPHVDQKIEGRVVNEDSGKEVARVSMTGAEDMTLDFGKVLAGGNTYRIDFYADLSKDGKYTAPVGDPATAWPDHQWRITGTADFADGAAGLMNVAGDVTVTMAHNAKWTNIAWPY